MRSSTVFVALASLAATTMAAEIPYGNLTTTVSAPVMPSGVPSVTPPPYPTGPLYPTGPSESPLPEPLYPTGSTNGTTNGTTTNGTYTPSPVPTGAGATFGPAGVLGFAVAGLAVAGAAIF